MATEPEIKGELKPEDDPLTYLYSKTFKCPVCNTEFIDFVVKRSKLRQIGVDMDFRMHFRTIDPNLYDVLWCNTCGYAALQSSFDKIMSKHQDLIKEKITPTHKMIEFNIPMSQREALTRYKRAHACANATNAKKSTLAILFLKMSWICKDAGDLKSEEALLSMAYKDLKEAFITENFPLGSMDEPTSKYMIAELARRTGDYTEALRMIGDVVAARGIAGSIKERAQRLKELIKEEKEAAEAK